ncbi:hypothetical protein J4G48_0040060 [Bradyrhizobium barranii subsp. apii]|uniref:hypothetical protein n=1 Tax=Bradyrhizobium barranii TaxID=2992140 RepID=UPI001AA1A78F|nr:hypothetical protein [Bradyrhizobium barranii]UPT95354.1 hypothetical protein J4G48_0040060 [Bradyrhizobium barranii subsp. apii]
MVAADDDRVSLGGEARYDADMPATAAAHGYDRADLRGDVLMLLPGESTVIDVLSASDLAQEGGAPQGAADTDLVGGLTDELAGSRDDAAAGREAALEARLEAVSERRLFLMLANGDTFGVTLGLVHVVVSVVMVTLVMRTRLCS